jgi:O-methyltransferase
MSVKFTSAENVLNNMPHKYKCVVKKGYFPETVRDVENGVNFSLVSLDADLYNPIKAGLEYFFPRMTSGGYIIVHDYGNPHWGGVRRAVDEFSHQHQMFFTPICDECGSVVFLKQ